MSAPTGSLNILPTLADLAAAGLAAAAAAMMKGQGSPANAAMEQLVAQVVGSAGARYLTVTDGMTSPAFGVEEKDAVVGVLRAGYSMSQSRGNQRALMDGAKGVLCSALGRQLGLQISFNSGV